mmetsp:Transcript_4292/g.5285  ORF Transcript_4292/g.5285 Transcript_4292/m.5285 type:complete len:437 (+) Transcript_4292:128-1438(+)
MRRLYHSTGNEESKDRDIEDVEEPLPKKDSGRIKTKLCRLGLNNRTLVIALAGLLLLLNAIFKTANHEPFEGFGIPPAEFEFPSIEERVKYYMGSWYDKNTTLMADLKEICKTVPYWKVDYPQWDHPYLWDRANLWTYHYGTWKILWNTRGYGRDVLRFTYEHEPEDAYLQMIMMFGDASISPHYPVVIKSRNATYRQPKHSPLPVLGYLRIQRHFGNIPLVTKYWQDASSSKGLAFEWKNKKPAIFFRGDSTGNRVEIVKKYIDYSNDDIDIGFSALVEGLENEPENMKYLKDRIAVEEQLSFKYLLNLEGNDVSSGLKWMLYSNSVVFMARPKKVSWAMEEYLVPYVHYVPIKDDFSNLLEMLEWARSNDEAVERISRQATKYIEDLYASPKAQENNVEIIRQMVARYHSLYGEELSHCHHPDRSSDVLVLGCC